MDKNFRECARRFEVIHIGWDIRLNKVEEACILLRIAEVSSPGALTRGSAVRWRL